MAVMVVNDIPGVDAETYEGVLDAAQVDDDPPDRLIVHAAGTTASGWRVISIWQSGQAFERFRDQRLIAAIQSLGLPLRPTFDRSDVHRLIQP